MKKVKRIILGTTRPKIRWAGREGNVCFTELTCVKITHGRLARHEGKKVRVVVEVME